ncbi:uncharacterized protein VTP21DRAFT_9226 [Calcarisporiella thermophila]|uniref:uncharacterized protein n=1 Tax=Calcarisporiella thermophila TaxID=911321 RepID=UPI003744A56F
MDLVLEAFDEYVLDSVYARIFPLTLGNTTTISSELLPVISSVPRNNLLRQFASLYLIVTLGGYFFYFFFASISYFFFYDHSLKKHPKFLKNQMQKEIKLACSSIPVMSLYTVPWFLFEVRGYSRLYNSVTEYGLFYLFFTIFEFLLFTDFGIYWIHRALHHRLLYARLHKPHHRWIVPTPFASHAFHPLDGYLQSLPYHIFVYIFPMHRLLYLGMFIFVNFWTIMIHDGEMLTNNPVINSSAHHTIHHLYFNYNYGQYSTLWDRVGKSHRLPAYKQTERQILDVWADQVKGIEASTEYDPSEEYIENTKKMD